MDGQFSKFFARNEIIMDIFENLTFTPVLILILTVLVFYSILRRNKYNLPPGPTGVPFFGYAPFLGPQLHQDLDKLKHTYGNVFGLYLGRCYTVFLADYDALKDAFSQDNQPSIMFKSQKGFDFIPDGVGFSMTNGEEWVEQRKFCVKSMKDHGVGKGTWEPIIQEEVSDFIKFVSSFDGKPMSIYDILTSSVSNNISAYAFGRRLPMNSPERKFLDEAMEEIMTSIGQNSIFNIIPFFRDLCIKLGIGRISEINNTMVKFNKFMRKEVEKIRANPDTEYESFIAHYLQEMKNMKTEDHYFNETNLLGNLQAIFLGGSDTTRVSIYWLILIMAVHPDIQSKAQQEIDSVLGKDGQVRWAERRNLPYVMATIMEAQRWRTIAVLNPARMATENIKIKGYDIPKGTDVVINIYGLHHDPKYWKNPEIFNPERFLSKDGNDVIMKPESFCPFSYGKRNCPGDIVALMEILHYFVALLQRFTITPVEGQKVNMEGSVSITYHGYVQDLCYIPR